MTVLERILNGRVADKAALNFSQRSTAPRAEATPAARHGAWEAGPGYNMCDCLPHSVSCNFLDIKGFLLGFPNSTIASREASLNLDVSVVQQTVRTKPEHGKALLQQLNNRQQ
jgi:hypothetical protein